MAEIIRVPINIALNSGNYTASITVGSNQKTVNVILDTGSSMMVVDGAIYDPSGDASVVSTQLAQTAEFASGTFVAAVLQGPVGFPEPQTTGLPGTNLAITYDNPPGTFGQADGILGLAFGSLDGAYSMPSDTWRAKYKADQLNLGQRTDIAPFVDQWVSAGRIANKFAFAVDRSTASEAKSDPADDPLNKGWFILGGGAECEDLYSGPFSQVAVVHEQYYNVNLTAIRVGDQSIDVPPVAAGRSVASNAIIDSGSTNVTLDQALYDRFIALFRSVKPDLGEMLATYSPNVSPGVDQSKVRPNDWPPVTFVLQGANGGTVDITVQPQDYWQFDSGQKDNASPVIAGDGGMLNGQSNLGLPLFAGKYVVFDRTGGPGRGVVGFATRAGAALVA